MRGEEWMTAARWEDAKQKTPKGSKVLMEERRKRARKREKKATSIYLIHKRSEGKKTFMG